MYNFATKSRSILIPMTPFLRNFRAYAARYPGDLVRIPRDSSTRSRWSRVLSRWANFVLPSKDILQCFSAPFGCHYLGCGSRYLRRMQFATFCIVVFRRYPRRHARAVFCGMYTQMEFNSVDKVRRTSCFLRWNSRGIELYQIAAWIGPRKNLSIENE